MENLFDKYGNHIGFIDEFSGSRARIYDQYRNHAGYIERTGGSRDRILDEYGNHTGYIERTGGSRDRILDEYGNHTGYIEKTSGSSDWGSGAYGNRMDYSRASSYSSSSGGGGGEGCLVWLIAVVVIIAMCVGLLHLLHAWANSYGPFAKKTEKVITETVEGIKPTYNVELMCGDGVWYLLDKQGNMTIFGDGNGRMKDCSGWDDYPWEDFKDYIKTVCIEDNVKGEIPPYAFAFCYNLTSVTIPGSIEVIGEAAFASCIRLEQVKLHEGVSTIGMAAFDGCESLKEITLPDSVKTIGGVAFMGCTALESIGLGNSIDYMEVFMEYHSGGPGEPKETLELGTFEGCEKLSDVRLPKTLKRIDSVAVFQNAAIADIHFAGTKHEWMSIAYSFPESLVGDHMDEFAAMGITIHYGK